MHSKLWRTQCQIKLNLIREETIWCSDGGVYGVHLIVWYLGTTVCSVVGVGVETGDAGDVNDGPALVLFHRWKNSLHPIQHPNLLTQPTRRQKQKTQNESTSNKSHQVKSCFQLKNFTQLELKLLNLRARCIMINKSKKT